MITQEQTLYTLAKEYPNCGFTIVVPQGETFNWSHILWTEGNSIPCPTEQETEDLWNNKWKAVFDNQPNKATDQASGNQKLLDLGLTQAEATALTGYTPTVAE